MRHLLKLFAIAPALLLSEIAGAQQSSWKKTGTTDSLTSYVDTARIRKVGDRLSVWILYDQTAGPKFTKEGNKAYLSQVQYNSVDCLKTAADLQASYRYAENMGKGAIVDSSTYPPAEPTVFPPDSIGEAWIQFACARYSQSLKPAAPPAQTVPKTTAPKTTSPF